MAGTAGAFDELDVNAGDVDTIFDVVRSEFSEAPSDWGRMEVIPTDG